ncbi:MAG TPA: hypothetical protein VGN12_19000 [Pirellulales bacterium]|jgi:hypothetical protein
MPDSVVAEFTGALKEDSMDAIKLPLVVVGIASVLAAGCCSPSSFGGANSPGAAAARLSNVPPLSTQPLLGSSNSASPPTSAG